MTEISIDGPINIQGVNYYGLPIEHTKEAWEQYGDQVESAISQFPVIIPEYFPPEYQFINSIPILNSSIQPYEEMNYLLHRTAEVCSNQEKDVWVLDPSYDLSFAVFRTALILAPTILTIPALIWSNSFYDKYSQKTTSRRTFLKICIGTILGASAFSTADDDTDALFATPLKATALIENNFRAAAIASHLKNLSTQLDTSTSPLVIYHPVHWDNIKRNIEDPITCQEDLNKFYFLKKLGFMESMFWARHYPKGIFEGKVNPVLEI